MVLMQVVSRSVALVIVLVPCTQASAQIDLCRLATLLCGGRRSRKSASSFLKARQVFCWPPPAPALQGADPWSPPPLDPAGAQLLQASGFHVVHVAGRRT